MKVQRITIAILVIFLIGIGIFAQTLHQQEQRSRSQDLQHRGNYLVSLVALHPMENFLGSKRDYIVKTLAEYVTSDGLIYCIVQDQTGSPLLSLAHRDVVAKIPTEVEQRSLYVNGFIQQTYKMVGTDQTISEFAKPIFEGGQRSGTVRMGFDLPPISMFSLERIKLMAIMAFFAFSMAVLVYYGVTLALRPLHEVNQNFRNICIDSVPVSPGSFRNGGVGEIIKGLEQSVFQLKDRYEKIQAENIDLTTKYGVISFEKHNVFNILDSINYGIIVTDIQDNITHINSYMLNFLDKKQDEVIDHSLGDVLSHDQIEGFLSQQEALKQSSGARHIEATFKNITSEKSAENAKHEFITRITHELLTPLTTINSYNEMLMDDEIDNVEMQKEFYNTINEETSRLTSLVKNLLNISKIEMGSLTLHKGLVKSDWLFDDCLTTVEGTAQKKNITIERNVPDSFPALFADKELLKVAVINILGNAVKYTPENGHIQFMLTEQDDFIIFEVIDDGYGISKEDLPHIFDKFYRSTDPRVTEQTGSGLGLALTSEIVRLHGGEIEVSSKPDEGSYFKIRLPKEEYYLGKQ
jgi:signal transduction histidine kinase